MWNRGPYNNSRPPTGGRFTGGWNSTPFDQGSENALGRQPVLAVRPKPFQGLGQGLTGGFGGMFGGGYGAGTPQIQPGMQMDPNRMPGNAMAQGVPSTMQGTQQMPQWTQAGVPQPGMPPRSGGAPIAPMNQMAPRPPGAPMGMMSPPPMDRMDPKAFKKLMANATQTDAMGTHNQAATRAQFLANQGRLSDKQMKKLGITARR